METVAMYDAVYRVARLRTVQFLAEEALRIAEEDRLDNVAIRLSEILNRVRDDINALECRTRIVKHGKQ